MKNSTRNKFNLIFSSFLVIGYIVCTFFFSTLAGQVAGVVGGLIRALILILFGLLIFYATRVGDGKQVKRFSLAVLLLLVLPCVYIIAASFIEFLPFHQQLAFSATATETGAVVNSQPIVTMLACIALGYGIPYTFLSGYELKTDDADAPAEEYAVLEGGLAQELAEAESEAAAEAEAQEAEAAEAEAEAQEAAEEEADPEKKAEAEEKAEAEKDAEHEAEAAIALQETRE